MTHAHSFSHSCRSYVLAGRSGNARRRRRTADPRFGCRSNGRCEPCVTPRNSCQRSPDHVSKKTSPQSLQRCPRTAPTSMNPLSNMWDARLTGRNRLSWPPFHQSEFEAPPAATTNPPSAGSPQRTHGNVSGASLNRRRPPLSTQRYYGRPPRLESDVDRGHEQQSRLEVMGRGRGTRPGQHDRRERPRGTRPLRPKTAVITSPAADGGTARPRGGRTLRGYIVRLDAVA
jgi:hypothetical protein